MRLKVKEVMEDIVADLKWAVVEYQNGHKFQEVPKPKYDCLLFDLDDPIYPYSSGVSVQIAKNIDECMIQKLGMEAVKVTELNYPFYKTYGMTMAGLRAIGYDFDYDDFNSFVHGRLPYDVLLKPDHVLRGILQSPLVRKVVLSIPQIYRIGTMLCSGMTSLEHMDYLQK
ncbi:uncharacterized protein [Glycine max]|uniref:uncharacterized protein n=1 Tax=Glycine max TaxID=3847 RepID=UPI0002336F73|nr:uncharacterized protein LOC121174139 [Glycine max]